MPIPATMDASTTALCVDAADEIDRLQSGLGDYGWLTVETATEPRDALSRLDGVDCLVYETAIAEADGFDLLEQVRERYPALPVVLFTCTSPDEMGAVLDRDDVEYVQKNGHEGTFDLLARRIRQLARLHRLSGTVRRLVAAVDTTQEGLCIVNPDGTIEFANCQYARRFGYAQESLLGRQWQDLYPESVVERIESTAFPTVDDGWRWTGDCTGRRTDGTTFVATTTVVGLEDGSRIFTVATPSGDGSTGNDAP